MGNDSQTCVSIAGLLSFMNSVNWLDWFRAIVDLGKGAAWPLSIFLIVWLFRRELGLRIRDLLTFGPSGVTLQPPSPGQTSAQLNGNIPEHPMSTVMSLDDAIRQQLQSIVHDHREPVLVRALAEARLFRDFEAIFGVIFQSQIDALVELEPIGSAPIIQAEEFFNTSVVPRNREVFSSVGFSRWKSYLETSGLISPENSGTRIAITTKGRDFLTFVRQFKQGYRRDL